MLNFKTSISFYTFSWLLISCFPGGAFFEQEEIDTEEIEEISVQLVGEAATANLSSSSTVTQKIVVPEGSSVQGASLSIPPGSLSIDMTISIEETVSIASLQDGDQVEYSNYAAVGYSNDAGVEQVSQPMTLQIPLSESSTLNLAESQQPNAVKLRVKSANASSTVCKEQFILDDEYSIVTADSKNVIELKSKFFGAYQPVRLVEDFYDNLKDTRDTLKEKIANGTASEEELLSAKSGCPIVTKTQKKELDVKFPVIIGDIVNEIIGRKIFLRTTVSTESPLTGCSVFFRNGYLEGSEAIVVNSKSSEVSIDFSQSLSPVKGLGRFECTVEDGRKVEKSFADVNLSPGWTYNIDLTKRVITFVTGMPDGGDCSLEAKTTTQPYETHSEVIDDPSDFSLDFNGDTDAIEFEAYFQCTYTNGTLKTGTAKFKIPACTDCVIETTPPTLSSIQFPVNITAPSTQTVDIYGSDDSGLDDFCFQIKASGGFTGVPAGCYKLTQVGDQHYQASIKIPSFLHVQSYEVSQFSIHDLVGNERYFYIGSDGYYKSNTYIQNQTSQNNQETSTNILSMGFTVAADTGHNPDTVSPSLVSILAFPSAVQANKDYQVKVSVSDGGGSANVPNPYVGICLEFETYLGLTSSQTTCLHDAQYSAGIIDAKLYLSSGFENGNYAVKRLFLIDLATNEALYNSNGSYPPTHFMEATGVVPPTFTFTGGSDYTPPHVTSVDMDANLYDVSGGPASATLILTASDVSGVDKVCIKIDVDTWNHQIPLGCQTSTDNGDGTYSTPFTLPDYLVNGSNYQAVDVEVYDKKGNRTYLYKYSSSDAYYTKEGADTNVLIYNFSFVNANTDSTAPTINNVSLSSSSIAAGNYISVNMDITDSGNAGVSIQDLCLTFRTNPDLRAVSECGTMTSLGGSSYKIDIYFDPWVENDVYKLTDLSVVDNAGNSYYLYATWSDSVFSATAIAVPSVSISGSTLDSNAPTLGASPAYFVSGQYYGNDSIEYIFDATDAISGINTNSMCIDITNGTDWFNTCSSLTLSGSNTYSFKFYVSAAVSSGTYYVEGMTLYDNAGNSVYYYSSGLGISYSPDPGWMPASFNYYP